MDTRWCDNSRHNGIAHRDYCLYGSRHFRRLQRQCHRNRHRNAGSDRGESHQHDHLLRTEHHTHRFRRHNVFLVAGWSHYRCNHGRTDQRDYLYCDRHGQRLYEDRHSHRQCHDRQHRHLSAYRQYLSGRQHHPDRFRRNHLCLGAGWRYDRGRNRISD